MLTATAQMAVARLRTRHRLLVALSAWASLTWCMLSPSCAQEASTSDQDASSAATSVQTSEQDRVQPASAREAVPLKEPVHTDVRTSSFQDITPGRTTLEELKARMGEPESVQAVGEENVLTYKLGPFPRVEMIVIEDIVDSVVVYLGEAARPQDIATELGLDNFVPSSILDDSGKEIGMVYPERGVAFSFEPDAKPLKVSQLVLSPISAEFFLLRAKDETEVQFERRLADANYALRLQPDDAEALWCKSSLLLHVGLYERAAVACETALEFQPDSLKYRLTWVELAGALGRHDAALDEIKVLLEEDNLPTLMHARLEALYGDQLAAGPAHDYEAAMDHHLAAVELAAPLANSAKPLMRRQARQVLIDVHLSVANDITRGDWTSKKEAAPKWLKTARTLADKLLAEDSGDERVRLLLLQKALSCYVGMKGAVDPTEVVRQALEMGRNLTRAASDVYRERQIQWMLVECLADAVRIEQMRGKTEKVQDYANEAIKLLNKLAATEDSPTRSDLLTGRLYFYVGSTFAIRDNDHQKAVRWYEKALPFLTRTRGSVETGGLGRHGQRFVSMGVSYWEADVHDEAMQLTEMGLDMMLESSAAGHLNSDSLAVPYGNLAAMYEAVGRGDDAQIFAAKAASIEGDTEKR